MSTCWKNVPCLFIGLCTERKVTRIPLVIREIAFAKLRAEEKKYMMRET